jgi:hypothetical protein
MKVGDLVMYKNIRDEHVRYDLDRAHREEVDPSPMGIVTHIDPEGIGDRQEVLVMWNDGGGLMNHSMGFLEVVNESR